MHWLSYFYFIVTHSNRTHFNVYALIMFKVILNGMHVSNPEKWWWWCLGYLSHYNARVRHTLTCARAMWHCNANAKFLFSALIVRFLTKRFIGDYEANTGKHYNEIMLLWSYSELWKCFHLYNSQIISVICTRFDEFSDFQHDFPHQKLAGKV